MNKDLKRRSQSKPVGASASQVQTYRHGDDFFGSAHTRMMSHMQDFMGSFGGMSLFDEFHDFGFGFGKARNKNNGSVQRSDPFASLLSGFDDFGTDFGKISSKGPNSGPAGNFVSQTYVYSQKLGPDGKPQVEKYFKSDMGGRNAEGKFIKQAEEMYKNTATGMKKIAHERVFNGKGHKAVKTKLGSGEEEIQNMFHGLEETDQQDFHRIWAEESKNLGLDKLASQMPKQKALEDRMRNLNPSRAPLLRLEEGDSESTTPSSSNRIFIL